MTVPLPNIALKVNSVTAMFKIGNKPTIIFEELFRLISKAGFIPAPREAAIAAVVE